MKVRVRIPIVAYYETTFEVDGDESDVNQDTLRDAAEAEWLAGDVSYTDAEVASMLPARIEILEAEEGDDDAKD